MADPTWGSKVSITVPKGTKMTIGETIIGVHHLYCPDRKQTKEPINEDT
jgi:hypothetical protein